jgi:2-methylaconitate cis-trans-isomerase PrpF
MRKFKTVFMRGGTSKGLMFHRKDLPDRSEWDSIFLQAMGNPDPKQIDGLGGTVSSNSKVVVVWKSEEPDIDIEYLFGQVVVGKNQVDYKANCGNMTSAVGPFAIEEGLVEPVEPFTTVRLLNRNTNKKIDVTVPVENGTFAQDGDCRIAGIDGTAAELKVRFLDPAGAKTGKLVPTGNLIDRLEIPGFGEVEATILDVSGPMVMARAKDIGLNGTETPDEINSDARVCELLEKIRGTAATLIGCAGGIEDATVNAPAVPKIGVFCAPQTFKDLSGQTVEADTMDICVRIISVFKCHKASPITSGGAVAVMALLGGTVVEKTLGTPRGNAVRIGHPSGVMTAYAEIGEKTGEAVVHGVAIQRTARRIMDGTLYIRN